ncbi:hypothetical protein P9209_16830 [Prescottella defluvii]|nr:hypothetical protein P9209_16830 [Prescottella defluvii]
MDRFPFFVFADPAAERSAHERTLRIAQVSVTVRKARLASSLQVTNIEPVRMLS